MDKHTRKHIHHSGLLSPVLSGNQAKKRGEFISVIGEIPICLKICSNKLLVIFTGVNSHFTI